MGRRKHVMQGLGNELEAPTAGQRVVRAVGSRGGNIVEVEFPNGGTTLCILPQKFNKTLYVKKGGYLLIEESAAPGSSNATAALCARPSSSSSHQEQPVSSPGTQASAGGCGTMPATKKVNRPSSKAGVKPLQLRWTAASQVTAAV
ncbi:RNA-binding EIF1AD [Haematococcus lacustris]|uniref:RNA-binding EIF1AD n=1 Tax=Haematococcus lacustris TaxID=44745 RepID=A0A699Z5P0_HAELA|nr:RNA-binding EIF1AD [Haematococcus lacustris]